MKVSQLPALSRNSAVMALLSVLTFLIIAYYPSLSVPFYLDDRDSILTNTMVQADTLGPLFNEWVRSRFIGYATLWANHQISGLDPVSYHWVNIAIHLLNFVLVYILTQLLLNCFVQPGSENKLWQNTNRSWAFAVAAFWAMHPLNSQVVIYVVQRLASVVAIFYLLSVVFYIQARRAANLKRGLLFGSLFVLCVIAGFHSKQNYASVLVFLYCWELFTCGAKLRRVLFWLTALGVTLILLVAPFIPTFWQALDQFTRDAYADGRVEYFYTQMIVLWDYLYRFVYPFSLQLEIGIDLKRTFEPIVALALVGHIILLSVAFKLRNKIPLLFVGIVFFYTSHLVESFIIPIKDLAFEHRAYIGNIGLSIALLSLLKYWLENTGRVVKSGQFFVVLYAIVAIYGSAVFLRAQAWQDPLTFYAAEVVKSPEHPRANASYGSELAKNQRFAEAEKYLKKSVDISLSQKRVAAGALIAYMSVLYEQKKYQKAASIAMIALGHVHNHLERSTLLSNLAVGYIYMGYCDFAVGLLGTALELNPNNKHARSNLAYCTGKAGR